jgi:glycolate oxidase iron-sulfur subunit
VGGQVVIFSGCVMDAWYGDVHRDTHVVLTAMGFDARFSDPSFCCGALHSHTGLSLRAGKLEERVTKELAGATVVVNSAGCGAHLLATFKGDGHRSAKIVDVMEFIDTNVERLLDLLPAVHEALRETVIVHDACHLRNLQGAHLATHRVLSHHHRPVPIPDEGLCCGAGGAYAIEQPDIARDIVGRKYAAIQTVMVADVRFISSGNPGCTGHLVANRPSALSQVDVVHPVQLVARLLDKVSNEGGE